MSSLPRLLARCGVNALRTLLLCTLLIGVTTSAQPPPDEPLAEDAAEAAGWNFEDEEEEAAPTLLELAGDQALDIGLFLAFAALAMVSFLRKSVPLKYVTLVAAVLYMGVYKSQLISVVNVFGVLGGATSAVDVGLLGEGAPTAAGVGAALTSSLPPFAYSLAWYAFAVFTVVTTIIWGRVYCGRICAFGALTQLIDAVVPKRFQLEIPPVLEQRASYIKYAILFGAIGLYFVTKEISFYRYIEPFWLFTFDATPVLWVHGRRAARREHLRPESLLPLPLPARRGTGPRLEGDDRAADQAVVRVQPVRALREDLRMGRDPQAADPEGRVRALRRLRDPLRRQAALPALAARAEAQGPRALTPGARSVRRPPAVRDLASPRGIGRFSRARALTYTARPSPAGRTERRPRPTPLH